MQIEIEKKVFEAKKDFYLENYEGKYIALLNGKVLDYSEDFSQLAQRVYEKFGYKEIFMTLVTRNKPRIRGLLIS